MTFHFKVYIFVYLGGNKIDTIEGDCQKQSRVLLSEDSKTG